MKKSNTTIQKCERELEKASRLHSLQTPAFLTGFIIFAIIADAATQYSIFDNIMTQNPVLTWIITLTVAGIMNVAPAVLAGELRNNSLGKYKKILCAVLVAVPSVLFAVTFGLRMSTSDIFFQTADLGLNEVSVVSDTVDTIVAAENHSAAKTILSILLALEPAATSAVCFVLAYETDPEVKKTNRLRANGFDVMQERNFCEAAICEINRDLQFDRKEKYKEECEAKIALMKAMADRAEVYGCFRLAMELGTAAAITSLLEDGEKTVPEEIKLVKINNIA